MFTNSGMGRSLSGMGRFLTVVLSLVVVAFATQLRAEIPIKTGKAFQRSASEKLEVLVTKVESKPEQRGGAHIFRITAELKVAKVIASATSVRVGDVLQVKYTRPNFDKSPQAGSWASTVKQDGRYMAYLTGKAGAYRPAAHSFTFMRLHESSEKTK